MANTRQEKEVDAILDGIGGAWLIGHRYLIKTVTYHYMGTVHDVGDGYIRLERVVGIGQAGSEADATVRIVTGKRKPEQYETFPPDHLVRIWIHAITEDQEVDARLLV